MIAETTDLRTKFAKIVVTDDQGRYVLPDLPKANYNVWVRGYGLVDSPKVDSEPGKILNLTRSPAPNAAAAAEYYPAIYWYSMVKIPDKSEFPGTGRGGNGINETMKSQAEFLRRVQDRRLRHLPPARQQGDAHDPGRRSASSRFGYEAWTRRIQSGQAGENMVDTIEPLGTAARA